MKDLPAVEIDGLEGTHVQTQVSGCWENSDPV